MRIADPPPGGHGQVGQEKVLVANGAAYILRGSAAKKAKVNHRVVITGTVSGGEIEATAVTVGAPVAGIAPNGTTRVLLMLAYWTAPDGLTQGTAHQRFFDDGNAWYRDASYGALGQVGDTTPWLRIAGPGGGCYSNHQTIMQQAKDEAVKLGYNLSSYDNFAVYFPNCGGDAAGFAAWAYVGSSEMWFNGYFSRREITHEQGHNYGLWHSHSYICDGGGLSGSCSYTEYGDDYDAMGSSSYSGHFSANQKNLLGWLGGGRTVDLSAGGSVTIVPMANDSSSPHTAFVSVPGSSRRYWLEYRQPVDFDNALPAWGTNGVLVHVTGEGSGSPDTAGSLIDVSPADGFSVSSATLKANSSWTTPEGLVIRVGAVTTSGVSVTVTRPSNCTLTGTDSADVLIGTAGNDVICGLGGNDIIRGQAGDDTIVGGTGLDSVDYANATVGVNINLTTGTATGQGTDTLKEIEWVDGSPFADTINGDSSANQLAGKAGNDKVYGNGGDDRVWGGDGSDTVGGGDGNDRIEGGNGIDTAVFSLPVNADLTTGTATGQGADTLVLLENLKGSAGNDLLRGSADMNVLQGGGGTDTIWGEAGNDKLYGLGGNDSLSGGLGTDTCDGGYGTDTADTCESTISIP